MGISSALFAGVSGLNTLGNSMSVIGDNIANVNTIGFKGARTTFETVLAQSISGASGTSQVGRGVALSAVDPIFSQGSFESTNEATDMAIGGTGFFMVRSPETGMFYTRAGHFRFDEEGYLVNPADMRVQGWILEPDSSDPRGSITDIQINATSSAPNATSEIDIAVNLNNEELFVETPASISSDPETESGFIFEDGVNDTLYFTDNGGTVSVDLINTGNNYFEEGTVYTGTEVAQALQRIFDDNKGVTNDFTVTYDSDANTFSIENDDGNNLTISAANSTMEDVLGMGTADTVIAAGTTATFDEVAYNITDINNSFIISVDGGDDVTVALDNGVYTIPELRVELEDKINSALGEEQAVTVDVHYDWNDNQFVIASSSRGERDSRIQLSALEGTTNNFLPTINMTDYTEHLGQDSPGYTLPGFVESARSNDSRFMFSTDPANRNDQLGVDSGATASFISVAGFDASTMYTGDEVAAALDTFLETRLGEAGNISVSYDEVTDRFSIDYTGTTAHTIEWSSSSLGATLGFTDDDVLTGGGSENFRSDSGVAFNILEDENDTLDVIINGNPENQEVPITVTIDDGVYTGNTLAEELEDKINEALAAAGESERVAVTYNETTSTFRIASANLGSESSIQLNSTLNIANNDLIGGTLQMDDDTINYGQGFSVENPDETANYPTSLVVYDSLGNQHTVTFYFRKADVSADGQTTTWEWFAYLPSSETASGEAEVQATGTLSFNNQGTLIGESAVTWLTEQADGTDGEGFDFGSGATPQQVVDINFGLESQTNVSTQFASPSSTLFQTQDGFGSGYLQDVSVDPDGVISGNYSNGQVLFLARVALANFTNPWGLSREGGNLWAETRSSGQPLTGTPGSAGMGKISPNSLEQSNVDLSAEFVNMIIQQRGFQANSRIITTVDDMLAELINLKR